MNYIDRLSKKQVALNTIEGPVILGQYLRSNDNNNEFLVPGKDSNRIIENEEGKQIVQFVKESLFLDNDILKNTLSELSQELNKISDYNDVNEIYPVLKNFDERLKITDDELFIKENLFHIEEICRDPHRHLKRDYLKVPVARAKRIPVKAINHLAAHSEDWSKRKIRQVEPRRIISEVVEYDLEIYENKKTKQLIDYLIIYFNSRLAEAKTIEVFVSKISDIINKHKSSTKELWFDKVNRDYERLGQLFENLDDSQFQLEYLLDFLQKIRNRLNVLQNSELYKANKNMQLSKRKVERTNLFENHEHYRFVVIFWKELSINSDISDEAIIENNIMFVNSFVDFTKVLIIRGLLRLGFDYVKTNNNELCFRSDNKIPGVFATIKLNQYKNIEVYISGEKIEIIPVIDICELSRNKFISNQYIFSLTNKSNNEEHYISINPENISSEESVTNILLNKILIQYFKNYKYKIDTQKISQYKKLNQWIKNQKGLVSNQNNRKLNVYLNRELKNSEKKNLNRLLLDLENDRQNRYLHCNLKKDINDIKMDFLNSYQHFSKYQFCIKCHNKNRLLYHNENGLKFKCSKKDCGIEYGFEVKDTGIKPFYRVNNCDQIQNNTDKNPLEKFGYEFI